MIGGLGRAVGKRAAAVGTSFAAKRAGISIAGHGLHAEKWSEYGKFFHLICPLGELLLLLRVEGLLRELLELLVAQNGPSRDPKMVCQAEGVRCCRSEIECHLPAEKGTAGSDLRKRDWGTDLRARRLGTIAAADPAAADKGRLAAVAGMEDGLAGGRKSSF